MKRMAGHLILNLGKNLPKTMFYLVARWAFPSLKVKERAFPKDKNGCGPKNFLGANTTIWNLFHLTLDPPLIPKAQSWLVLNFPVFMFVYINFNVPPTRITDLVRNVSDGKIY